MSFNYRTTLSPRSGRSIAVIAVIVCVVSLALAAVAYGHGGATGIVKERMDAMKKMGDASKSIGKMIKGETAYSAASIAEHAQTINDHSYDVLDYFPEGSLQKASEALPEIWHDWDEFERLAERLQTTSAELIAVAQNGNKKAARKQFFRVAKSCKGCHEDFRKKKE